MKQLNTFEIAAINNTLKAMPKPLQIEAKEGWASGEEEQVLAIRPVGDDDIKFIPVFHPADLEDGLTPEEIAETVESIYSDQLKNLDFDAKRGTSKDYILSNVQARLIRPEKTDYARKHNIILVPFLNMYIYFAVTISENLESGEIVSYSLDQANLDASHVTVDELLEASKKNLRSKVRIESIEDVLNLTDEDFYKTFYVASNTERHFGAAVMLLTDVLTDFERKAGTYHIIPSSVHEVLLVPDSLNISEGELRDMLVDVNTTIVKDEEVLGSEIYSFANGRLKVVHH